MPFSWRDFASKGFRCKLVVCWDGEPRTLGFGLGVTRDCRQGASAWFSSDSSFCFLICRACALGKESYRLWLRPEWVQSKAELVEVVQNLLYLRQDPKRFPETSCRKIWWAKSMGMARQKAEKTLLPWVLLFRDKIPLISTKEQNPGSPEDWALPTRHHLKAEDCRGFDALAEAQNRANVSAGLLN